MTKEELFNNNYNSNYYYYCYCYCYCYCYYYYHHHHHHDDYYYYYYSNSNSSSNSNNNKAMGSISNQGISLLDMYNQQHVGVVQKLMEEMMINVRLITCPQGVRQHNL